MFAVLPITASVGAMYAIKRYRRNNAKLHASIEIQRVWRGYTAKKRFNVMKMIQKNMHAEVNLASNEIEEDIEDDNFINTMRKQIKSRYRFNKKHR